MTKKYQEEFNAIFKDETTCKQMLLPYRRAQKYMEAVLEGINDEIKSYYEHSPIHHIKSRIKDPYSIIDKLYRRGFEVSVNGVAGLQDICGMRVVCKYIDDVYDLRKKILEQPGVEILRESDYIKYPKTNGYRSYHLIISIPIGNDRVPVEIQIRTIAMDMWASLEHNLRYKTNYQEDEDITYRLYNCSKMLEQADEEMQAIYKELNNQWKERES